MRTANFPPIAVLELPNEVRLAEACPPTSRRGQIVMLYQSNQAKVPGSVLEGVQSRLGILLASSRRRVPVLEPGRGAEAVPRGYGRSLRDGLRGIVLLHEIQRQVDDAVQVKRLSFLAFRPTLLLLLLLFLSSFFLSSSGVARRRPTKRPNSRPTTGPEAESSED